MGSRQGQRAPAEPDAASRWCARRSIGWRTRSASGNAIATLLARAASTVAQALAFAIVAKTYGVHELDHYALGFAVATLAALTLDFGTSTWITRETALSGQASAFAWARTPLVAALLSAGLIGALTHVVSAATAVAIVVMSLALATSLVAQGVFWGHLMHEREMAFAIAESGLVLLFLTANHFGVLVGEEPLLYTAAAYALGAIGRCLALPQKRGLTAGTWDVYHWWRTIHPYGVQGMITVASTQLDTVLLAALVASRTAGTVAAYALAMRVYYAAPMPMQALSAALLPRFVHDASKHRRTAAIGSVIGTVATIVAAAVFLVIVPLFGYGAAVVSQLRAVMEILSIAVIARCAAYVLGAFVTAQGRQRARLWSSLLALTTMAGLDVILIPRYGITGAAVAMVIADWTLLAGYLLATIRIVKMQPGMMAARRVVV